MSSKQSTAKLSLKEEIALALGIEKSQKGQLFDKEIIAEIHKYSAVFSAIREAKKLASENSQVDTEKLVSTTKEQITAISSYELPPELVKVEKNDGRKTVVLSRISSVLSQNKMADAVKFAEGTLNLLRTLKKGDLLVFQAIAGKSKVATQLFRNPFSRALLKGFTALLDRDIVIAIRNRDNTLQSLDLLKLEELYTEGLSTSALERTEVYDTLFSEMKDYSKSHYNQYLQWSFGLARRSPEIEFSALVEKYKSLSVDITDLDKRASEAIKLLKQKRVLFDLSEIALETAISKINRFNEYVKEYAVNEKVPSKVSRLLKKKLSASEISKLAQELSIEEKKALVAELNSSLLE